MDVEEIAVASVITKSNLPGVDYVINPYVGCMHSCLYCYARFMKRFTGHTERWGSFVDVKVNAPELVEKKTEKYKGKSILLASVTDAYMPLERKYGITRRILEKLIPLEPNLSILTKSNLVLRDIDLLKQFPKCTVGMTITSMDDKVRREIEPFASTVESRIGALKRLREEGLLSYVFIGPILPGLTDWRAIIEATRSHTNDYIFESLNIRGDIWQNVERWLKEKHPQLLEKYKEIYFTKNSYWENERKEIEKYCKERKLDFEIYFHHGTEGPSEIERQTEKKNSRKN
jgi:DNA repair photolyase